MNDMGVPGMPLSEACERVWGSFLRAIRTVAGPLYAKVEEEPQQSMLASYRDYWLHVSGEGGGLRSYLGNDLHAEGVEERLNHQVALRLETLSDRELYFSSDRLGYQNQRVSPDVLSELKSGNLDDKLSLIN